MKQEDFDRLKAVCEKEGFGIQHFHTEETYHIWKKDIWEGVEFAELHSGGIYKILGSDPEYLFQINCGGQELTYTKTSFKPSTEQAYVDQLKAEAFKRFGEIKEGDRFDRDFDNYKGEVVHMPEYKTVYFKNGDEFHIGGNCIYQKGKWATRVKERVKVKPVVLCKVPDISQNAYLFSFEISNGINPDYSHHHFLASKLEEYLNKDNEVTVTENISIPKNYKG